MRPFSFFWIILSALLLSACGGSNETNLRHQAKISANNARQSEAERDKAEIERDKAEIESRTAITTEREKTKQTGMWTNAIPMVAAFLLSVIALVGWFLMRMYKHKVDAESENEQMAHITELIRLEHVPAEAGELMIHNLRIAKNGGDVRSMLLPRKSHVKKGVTIDQVAA
ncbi:MAG: hypothetical protein AAFX04_13215 [Pseudomonadota bacterium]